MQTPKDGREVDPLFAILSAVSKARKWTKASEE
jgi:hypothetical protein